MAMKWNSKDYQFDPNGGNGGESFEVHNECMKSSVDLMPMSPWSMDRS